MTDRARIGVCYILSYALIYLLKVWSYVMGLFTVPFTEMLWFCRAFHGRTSSDNIYNFVTCGIS